MKYNLLNALLYEICLAIVEYKPELKRNWVIDKILEHCFQDWVAWRTEQTMRDVDQQAEDLKVKWKEEENKLIVERFQKQYPEAKVTLHDENTGAVLIEHPPDGSKAQELLGGAMEIKSPWSK
jgi:hypothetical protein